MAPIRRGTKRKLAGNLDERQALWIGFQERIPERFQHLANDASFADMHFIVGAERVKMPGHKLIIGISSSVLFRQMRTSSAIEIRDVSPSVWLKVLQAMYGGQMETILTAETVLGCLKCAKRYDLKDLRYQCMYFIRRELLLQSDDDIPVSMLDSVTITEAINMRREIFTPATTAVSTIQWRCPFRLDAHGLGATELRRLVQMHMRNLEVSHIFNTAADWFRTECRTRRMPKKHKRMDEFLLERCPRLNFPAMTPGQYNRCIEGSCHLTAEDVEQLHEVAHRKRRLAIGNRRQMHGPASGIASQRAKAGIYEVPLMKTIRVIKEPDSLEILNRTIISLTSSKLIVIHGFAVPVRKDTEAGLAVLSISPRNRTLTKTTTSGMKRLIDQQHDLLYVLLHNPILVEPTMEYKFSMRALSGACAALGEFYDEIVVNDIKFTISGFQQTFTHALFVLFEDPRMYADVTALTIMDLMAFVRRPRRGSNSSPEDQDDQEIESRV